MKNHHATGLAMLTGIAIGAFAVQGLFAQTKPPVYVVIDFSEITDPEGYKALSGRSNAASAQVFADFGAQYLSRTDNITPLDGTPPKRFIMSRFDSVEKAKAWYNSPEQKKVSEVRNKTTKSRVFLVEGM
jgi:uncharacterized protein (DUF1330 family)